MEKYNYQWLSVDFHLKQTTSDPEIYHKIWAPDQGCPEIPLLETRIKHLNEVCTVLKKEFDGQIFNLIKKADNSAVKLLNLILQHFPCFRDTGFYKRAQLFICDVWNHCRNLESSESKFCTFDTDFDQLSVFADYRNPQTLLEFECINYTEELRETLKNRILIPKDDVREMEIRAATIEASERIVKMANDKLNDGIKINSVVVDQFLWVYAKFHMDESKALPYHLTRCVWY